MCISCDILLCAHVKCVCALCALSQTNDLCVVKMCTWVLVSIGAWMHVRYTCVWNKSCTCLGIGVRTRDAHMWGYSCMHMGYMLHRCTYRCLCMNCRYMCMCLMWQADKKKMRMKMPCMGNNSILNGDPLGI